MTKTTREMEATKNENTFWMAFMFAVFISVGFMILYTQITIDKRLENVPQRVCHNETKETGYIVCSATSRNLENITITAIPKVQYRADKIDSVSVMVNNISLPYDNCIPYEVEQEVCEIK